MNIARSMTRLHTAAEDDECALAERLIAEGVDVDVRGAEGETPLHFAAEYNEKGYNFLNDLIEIFLRLLIILPIIALLFACGNDNAATPPSPIEIKLGGEVFKKNCAVCHGDKAQGLVKDWKKSVNGAYPPPPLNGTAHTWHHSPKTLLNIINNGGVKFGGSMPGFKNKLTKREKQATLDYIYSLWSVEIQQIYDKKFKQKR